MTGFLKKRPAALWAAVIWAAGIGTLLGSMVLSTSRAASAAGPPNQTVTANQGDPGTVPWSVIASQSGAWSVTIKAAKPYVGSCGASTVACTATTPVPAVVRDVAITAIMPTGHPIEECIVTATPLGGSTIIPVVKQGSDPSLDWYVGNSQVDLAVAAGGQITAEFFNLGSLGITDATFQGESSS